MSRKGSQSMTKANRSSRSVILTHDQAKCIKTPLLNLSDAKSLNAWDAVVAQSGFQRKRSQSKVDQVVKYLSAGITFAPVMLADIGGELYYVDGQHRGAGHIKAGAPLQAFVVQMTMDEACRHFMVHNSKATRVPTSHILDVSRNPCALKVKSLATKYSVQNKVAYAIVTGLTSGASTHGPNLVDDDARIVSDVIVRAEAILRLWSESPLWDPGAKKSSPKYWFSHQGVLNAVAILARQKASAAKSSGDSYSVDDMVADLAIIRNETQWDSDSHARSEHSGKSQGHIRNMVERYKNVLINARDREAREFRRKRAAPVRVAKTRASA